LPELLEWIEEEGAERNWRLGAASHVNGQEGQGEDA
jgi:hypothetical protein